MNYLRLISASLILLFGISTFGQTFKKGDMVTDINIGMGIAKTTNSYYSGYQKELTVDKVTKILFTQRIGFEFGVLNINDKSSIGLGFSFLNSNGANTRVLATGTYDYSYTVSHVKYENKRWQTYQTSTKDRIGSGSAIAKSTIDDFTAMLRVAYHYSFTPKLDTYAGLGFGVSYMHNILSDYYDVTGFSSDTSELDKDGSKYQLVYSYDDLDHVKWTEGGNEGRFAAAAYVGARYYLNTNIALQAELGMPNITFKKDRNNYSIFSLGMSYKF